MTAADLEVVARFLARRDVASLSAGAVRRGFDVLVLCGSAVLASLDAAARAYHGGVAGHILVTGGRGHSTPYLDDAVRRHPRYAEVRTDGRPEAAIFAEILQRHLQVPAGAVTTEEESTNCGENAELSLRVLARSSRARALLLVQDPTMQRRTHASFEHQQRGVADRMEVVSFAPFVPVVRAAQVGSERDPDVWTRDRFTSLALGEIRRLRDDEDGYGPRGAGFIGHVEVPGEVEEAYARLRGTVPPELAQR